LPFGFPQGLLTTHDIDFLLASLSWDFATVILLFLILYCCFLLCNTPKQTETV